MQHSIFYYTCGIPKCRSANTIAVSVLLSASSGFKSAILGIIPGFKLFTSIDSLIPSFQLEERFFVLVSGSIAFIQLRTVFLVDVAWLGAAWESDFLTFFLLPM